MKETMHQKGEGGTKEVHSGWSLEGREDCCKMRQKGQAGTRLHVTLRDFLGLCFVLRMPHSAASLVFKHYSSSHCVVYNEGDSPPPLFLGIFTSLSQ